MNRNFVMYSLKKKVIKIYDYILVIFYNIFVYRVFFVSVIYNNV